MIFIKAYRSCFWFVYFHILHKLELRYTSRFLSVVSPYSFVPRFGKVTIEWFSRTFWTDRYDMQGRCGFASRIKGYLS